MYIYRCYRENYLQGVFDAFDKEIAVGSRVPFMYRLPSENVVAFDLLALDRDQFSLQKTAHSRKFDIEKGGERDAFLNRTRLEPFKGERKII